MRTTNNWAGVKMTPTLRFTLDNLANAARVRAEKFARTGSVTREDGAEVTRLVRDVHGLTAFTVSEEAIREWAAFA